MRAMACGRQLHVKQPSSSLLLLLLLLRCRPQWHLPARLLRA
jgi:hypothetical protein